MDSTSQHLTKLQTTSHVQMHYPFIRSQITRLLTDLLVFNHTLTLVSIRQDSQCSAQSFTPACLVVNPSLLCTLYFFWFVLLLWFWFCNHLFMFALRLTSCTSSNTSWICPFVLSYIFKINQTMNLDLATVTLINMSCMPGASFWFSRRMYVAIK